MHEASRAIWDWKGEAARASALARTRQARARGAVQGAIGLGAGAALWAWSGGPGPLALAALILGGAAILGAILAPRAMQTATLRASQALGAVITAAMLVVIFVIFIAPFGLLFRRGARDPLARRIDRGARSYWQTVPESSQERQS